MKSRSHAQFSISLTEKTVGNPRKYGIKRSAKYCSKRDEKNRSGFRRVKHSVSAILSRVRLDGLIQEFMDG